MNMFKNTLALAAVATFIAGCATAPADTTPAPPTVDAGRSCFSSVAQLPQWSEPEAGLKRAWAVVQYELDGSGASSAVRLSSSSGSTAFDTGVVRSYALAKFTPGVKRAGCTELASFERR
jgi:nitrous oxide reductase accessory protein NosL